LRVFGYLTFTIRYDSLGDRTLQISSFPLFAHSKERCLMWRIQMDPAYRRLHVLENVFSEVEGRRGALVAKKLAVENLRGEEKDEIAELEIQIAAVTFEVKQASKELELQKAKLPHGDRCRRYGCRHTRRTPQRSGSERKKRRSKSAFCGPCSGTKSIISTKALRELVGNEELNVVVATR